MRFRPFQNCCQFEDLVKPHASQLLGVECQCFKFWHQIHSVVGDCILNGIVENKSRCLGFSHVYARLWAPGKALTVMLACKLALAGASFTGRSLFMGAPPATQPSVLLLLFRRLFLLSPVSWHASYRRSHQATLWYDSCTSKDMERLSNQLFSKISYSCICSLKWYKLLKMQSKNINDFCKIL